jgi:magnesium chelatase family protein
VSLLKATEQINGNFEDSVIIGELSLSGSVKDVNGVLAITQHAKEQGFKRIFLPEKSAKEAGYIEGIEIYPVKNLKQLINNEISQYIRPVIEGSEIKKEARNFSEILGLQKAKRALAIAAAGGHNLLFNGSPGCGKTILARAIKDLLPELSRNEALETTKIFSIAGLIDVDNPLIKSRPFREVHHTASLISITGGGAQSPKPGELSLAHNGVLFFDEISEFPRSILESLRQPLEDKYINISRANFSVKFPTNFIFIATTNPCPCGFDKDKKIKCKCSETQKYNYQKKISGPMLDRFDIFIEVERVAMRGIFEKKQNKNEEELKRKILLAKKIQKERFEKIDKIKKNSDMGLDEIKKFCNLNREGQEIINKASDNIGLSNRAYLKTLKLARTIADLEASQEIKIEHVGEALQYRR